MVSSIHRPVTTAVDPSTVETTVVGAPISD